MISSFIGWAAASQNVAQGPILSVNTSSLSVTPVVLNASSTGTLTITNIGTESLTINSLRMLSTATEANVSLLLNMNGSNGGTTFTDSTALNTVTAVGGAQISTTQSKFGGASAYFDGSGDYLSMPANDRFAFGTGDFTVECWVRPTIDGTWRGIFSSGDGFSNQLTIRLMNTDKLQVYFHNGTFDTMSTTSVFSNVWTHIAVSRASNNLYMFINGVLTATTGSSTTNWNPTITSSVSAYVGNDRGYFFQGYIDDLRITKGVARYTANFTPPTEQYGVTSTDFTVSGCTSSVAPGATCPLTVTFAPTTTTGAKTAILSIAHNGTTSPTTVTVSSSVIEADNDFYRTVLLAHMDGANASTTIIDSTNRNTFTVSGNTRIRTTDSKFGGASAYFDGNGYIAVAPNNDFAFGTGDFTIECWFKPEVLNRNHGVFSLVAGPAHLTSPVISIAANSATNQLNYSMGPNITGGNQTGQTVLNTSTWYHLAIVRNSSVIRIYLNGVAEPIFPSASTTLNSTTNFTATYLAIGGYFSTDYTWKGYIDDFRVTKGLARYTNNFSVPSAPFSDAQGGVALISISAASLNVAATRLGQTTTSTITVTNTGVTPLTISNLSIAGTNAADFSVSGCSSSVAANASCTLTVSFTPSTIGSKTANLIINSNAYNSASVTVPITSTAVNPAITLSANTITLANIVPGDIATSNLTVTSSGTTALTISSVTLQGTDAADFTVTNGCSSSIAANSNCAISVAFDPVGTGDKYLTNTSLLMNMNGTNGSTTFTDATGKNTSFTVYGNSQISTAQSKFGGASAAFDGTGDYITVPSSNEFVFGTGDFTIECWFKSTIASPSASKGIVQLSSNTGYFASGTTSIALSLYQGTIYFGYGNSSNSRSKLINDTNWHHAAMVRKSGVCSLYIDGVLATEGSGSTTDTTNYAHSYLLIAGYGASNQTWSGYIDDLRITKGVARYTGNFTPPTTEFTANAFSTTYGTRTANLVITHDAVNSPSVIPVASNVVVAAPAISLSTSNLSITSANIGSSTTGTITVTNPGTTPLTISQLAVQSGDQYWDNVTALLSMDGTNGSTTFTDSSSFARTMTATGNVQISTANSKFGGASALFSGNGQIGTSSSTDFAFGSGDFTIEFWTKFNTNTPLQRLIYFSDEKDNIDMGADGTTMTYWDGGSVTIATGVNTTSWNHIAVSRNSGTLYFFLNGTLVTSRGSIHNSSARSLHIGGTSSGAQPFNGYIDDLRITKGVGRYTASFTAPTVQHPAFVTTAQVEFSASGCSSAVPAGGNCGLTITFTPTVSGTQTGRLLITHNAAGSPTVVNLTSTGVAVPLFSAASSIVRLTTDAAGTTTGNLIITNTGSAALTLSNLSITGANIADFSVSGCSSSIPASETCTLTTTFAPSTVGNKTANLLITHSASGSPSTINLIGDSTEPDFYFNNNSLLLHMDGTNGATTFVDVMGKNTFTRAGSAQISTAQSKFGGASGAFAANGDSVYTTNKTELNFGTGDFTIELWARMSAVDAFQVLLSKGYASSVTYAAYMIVVSSGTLMFYASTNGTGWAISGQTMKSGLVANQWYHIAVVRASGVYSYYIDGVKSANTTTLATALVESTQQPLNIGSDSSASYTNTAKAYIDEVRITKGVARYTAAFTPSTVPFSNAAAAVPVITTSTSNLSIASTNTGSTNTGTITITNTGTVPLTVSNLSISGTNASDFTVSGCSTAVAANSSCTLTVTFAPSAVGSKSATLTILSNAYNAATTTVALSSTAVAPAISLSANTLSIASTTTGYTNTGTITVTNTGTAPLTVSSLSLLSADANVSLLLNMNGSNGSTTFTDSTNLNTVTVFGGAQISTAQSRFGGASAYFDGSGDYLSMPANGRFAFGTGDFTIEFWARKSADGTSGYDGAISVDSSRGAGTGGWFLELSSLRGLFFAIDGSNNISYQTTINDSQWHHWCVQRRGTSIELYKDGALLTSGTNSTNIIANGPLTVGAMDGSYPFNGYIDDVRITKGVARYTANFTAPTEQLTNSTTSTDFTVSGCATSVAAGSTCPLTVTFAPSTVGSKAATLYIAHNASGSPSTVSVSSTALAPTPAISLNTSTLTFADTFVGSSTTSNITVSNTGTAPLTVSSLSFSGANAAEFAVSGCTSNVAVGGNCVVSVTFTPTTGGSKSATLSIAHNATGSPSNVSISGTAKNVAISLSASSLTLQSVIPGDTSSGNIVVTSSGQTALTISNVTISGTNAGDFVLNSGCSGSLAANSNCSIGVTFNPVGTGDQYWSNTSLMMNMNGTNNSTTFTDATGKTTSFTRYGDTKISTVQSKFGGASAYFDGTGDYITLPSNNEFSFGTGDFTIECWIRPSATNNNGIVSLSSLVGYFGGSGTITLTVYLAKIAGYIGSTGFGGHTQQTTISTNQWYHIALVRRSGVVTVYQDGVAQPVFSNGTSTQLSNTTNFTYTNLLIGGYNSTSQLWNGYIDDLRITKGVARYTGNFTPPTTEFTSSAFSVPYGTRTANLVITHDAINSPSIVPIDSAVLVAAPNISVSTSDLSVTTTNVGSSSTNTITVTNTGTTPLTISNLAISGANAGEFSVSGCASAVAAGANCTLTVTFTPTSAGNKAATLSITHNATGSPTTINLTSTAIAPAISLSSNSLTLSNATVGSSSTGTITVTNTGTAPLTVSNLAISGANAGEFSVSGCSSSVAAGATCTLTVTFTPTSGSSKTATLSITHNAAGSPSTVSLSSTGIAPAISLSPSTLTIANTVVGSSTTSNITVSNTGTAPLTVSSLSFSGTNASDFIASGCSGNIAVGGNCVVAVTFTPTTSGSKAATLSVAHNAPGSPSNVSISSNAIVPIISLSANTLSITSTTTGYTNTGTITVTNTGTAPLTVSELAISGANASDFTVSGCASSVAAGGTCTLTVTFAPSTTGSKTATLSIIHNATGSPSTVSLSSTALAAVPVFSISSNSLSLSTSPSNTTTGNLTITNNGTGPLTISNLSITGTDAVDFSVTGCSSAVSPGANCVLTVTFTPTATSGSKAATLSITHNASGSPNTVTLNGSIEQPDIYFNSTSLLLHADGTNGSTTFIDSTSKNTFTRAGSAQISTAQSKFGGASGIFAANGDSVYTTNKTELNFGTGDFTIELWARMNAVDAFQVLLSKGYSSSVTYAAYMIVVSSGTLMFYASTNGTGWSINGQTMQSGLVANQWYHIAVVRASGVYSYYIDGVKSANTTTLATALVESTQQPLNIGSDSSASYTNTAKAYIDDVRITKGVARYSSNFNVPTAAFPNISGTAADIRVDTTSVSISATDVGSTRTATITVTNAATATANLVISSLSLSGTNSADFAVTGCSSPVAIGGSCTLTVTFAPTSISTDFENRTATLMVSSNAYNGTVSIQLTAVAAQAFDPYFGATSLAMHMDGTNNSTTFIDATGKQSFTQYGDVKISTAQSKFGGASAYFDGTGDYITVPMNSNDFNFFTHDFTIECWINAAASMSNNGFLSLSSAAGYFISSGSVSLVLSNNKLAGWIQSTGFGGHAAQTTLNTNQWYHVALVRNSGIIRIYLNGVAEPAFASGTATSLTYTSNITYSNLLIGGYDSTSRLWNGYIDDLRITKGIARYTENFTPPVLTFKNSASVTELDAYANQNVLLMHMDGANGSTTFTDSSGYHVFTRVGTPQISSAQSVSGGTSLAFNGGTDALSAGHKNTAIHHFGDRDFTIECWVRFNAVDTFQVIFTKGYLNSSASYAMILIALNPSGNTSNLGVPIISLYLTNSTTSYAIADNVAIKVNPQINTWYHIAISRVGNNYYAFCDGIKTATVANSNGLANLSPQNYVIGNDDGPRTNGLRGYIDELRITRIGRYVNNFTPATRLLDSTSLNSPVASVPSVYFDGTGDYLSVSANNNFSFGTGDFAVEAWILHLARPASGNQIIYDQWINSSGSQLTGQWQIAINSSGQILVILATGASTSTTPITSSGGNYGIPLARWTHIALSRSGTTLRLFINGRLDKTATSSASIGLGTPYPVNIGRMQATGASNWNGYIAGVRVTKGAAVYTTEFDAPNSALTVGANTVLLLTSSGTSIVDATSNTTITAVGDSKLASQLPGQL